MIKTEAEPSNDLVLLTILAASIATDNVNKIESAIKELKIAKVKENKIYETILHSYLFCGFPIVIESLKLFKLTYPKYIPESTEYNVSKFIKSGKINCKLVYKNNYIKLIENMNRLSPDLRDWMIIEGYGKVMSRKGLTMYEREFITVAILSTKFYKDQLHSHLKGCINFNATKNEIEFILGEIKHITGAVNFNKTIKLLKNVKSG